MNKLKISVSHHVLQVQTGQLQRWGRNPAGNFGWNWVLKQRKINTKGDFWDLQAIKIPKQLAGPESFVQDTF